MASALPDRFSQGPLQSASDPISIGSPFETSKLTRRSSDAASVPPSLSFKCAVTDSKGPRRFMEDAHSIVVPFAGVRGQGFFAIFDGHAGRQAAEWCGHNFVSCLMHALRRDKNASIPDILNQTFHDVDNNLSKLSQESDGKMHSGCTAVTAFLRLEDESGGQSFLPRDFELVAAPIASIDASKIDDDNTDDKTNVKVETELSIEQMVKAEETSSGKVLKSEDAKPDSIKGEDETKPTATTSKLVHAVKTLGGAFSHSAPSSGHTDSQSSQPSIKQEPKEEKVVVPPANVRRVLYCANAGDARGVLCRGGRAVRLTYDHKGTDKQEAKRITNAGGFVMNGRVNGVLAVTRSLGDSSMKEFVVGSPYTTETELSEQDEFLILACDGLWDVVNDQGAVDLVRGTGDPRKAAEELLEHAYSKFSQDNVTVLVVRFREPPETSRTN